ncbi:MAG TPA: hypothetical protein VMT20_03330 [Terriglobia bacterium]|nr:hypothetical protein [Terriglobia bacterium]
MSSLSQFIVTIQPDAGADAEDLERLSTRLREELRELDVESVETVDTGPAPPGAKGNALAIGSLALTLAPIVIPPLINLLQSWLNRHEHASLTLEDKNGEKLSISGNPTQEQQEVIASWLRRQQA